MSLTSLCPLNIINLIRFLGLGLIMPILLSSRTLDIRNVHLVSHELRRSDRSDVYLGNGVAGVKGVRRLSFCCECDTLG